MTLILRYLLYWVDIVTYTTVGGIQYRTVTSTFAEVFVAYAAPGDFVFRRFVESVEAGRVNCVAAATAKV